MFAGRSISRIKGGIKSRRLITLLRLTSIDVTSMRPCIDRCLFGNRRYHGEISPRAKNEWETERKARRRRAVCQAAPFL